jgi:replicative DNA helicase
MTMQKLPEDLDAERALLATLAAPGILDPGSLNAEAQRAALEMRPEYFVHPAHRAVCAAIQALYAEGAEIGLVVLKAKLEQEKRLGYVGGFAGLVEMLSFEEVGRPTVLVDRLLNLWRAREVIQLGIEAQRRGIEEQEPVGELVTDLANRLTTLATGATGLEIWKGTELLDRLMAGQPFRDPNGSAKLVHFGIPAMDDVLEASASHVITIGARPGVGKSALEIQGVWRTALAGERPFLISLEMDRDEIGARLAAWQTGEPYKTFRQGTWTASSVESMVAESEALERITTWCHPSGVPWAKVEAAIRDAVRIHGCTSAWIDHSLLIAKPIQGKGSTDAACWSALSRGIKRLAQELRICIVVLIQLNRQGAEGEPKLSDLKESGAWEEDANAVWMLWDKNQNAEDTMAETKEIYVKAAKNRSGASGWKRELEFWGALNRFREVEQMTDPVPPPGLGPVGANGRYQI